MFGTPAPRRSFFFMAGALAVLSLAASVAAEPSLEERVRELEKQAAEAKPPEWTFEWKDTFRLARRDRTVLLSFGGRTHNDWAFFFPDARLDEAVEGFQDGTLFRRARLYVSGELYQRVELRSEFDFAGGNAIFRDVYAGLVSTSRTLLPARSFKT
jgi:phosphate-selective porin